jgi:hypothetical protein
MRSLSGVTTPWWDAGGDFSLALIPTHSQPDVKPRGALSARYKYFRLGDVFLCMIWVWLVAVGDF